MSCSPIYFAGSVIFMVGSIAYTIDALLKKDKFAPRNLGYLIGSVLFVIGCGCFIADSCGASEVIGQIF